MAATVVDSAETIVYYDRALGAAGSWARVHHGRYSDSTRRRLEEELRHLPTMRDVHRVTSSGLGDERADT